MVLVGFGLDSVIECAAAGVLLWRLRLGQRRVAGHELEAAERRVHRFVGVTFFALAAYVGSCVLILLNIPLALVGGVVSLWLSGQNLSVPSSVGFIALFGIALLNGMVLVTYLNQLRREGLPVEEAAIEAPVCGFARCS